MKTINNLREIAWYGIKFTIPVEFQPVSIAKNHLLFEQEGKPVFEVKWQKNCSKPDPERIINKLAEKNRHFIRAPQLIEVSLPTQGKKPKKDKSCNDFDYDGFSMLKDISPDFTPYPFTWKTTDTHAQGVIMLCSKCQGISILQFFQSQNDKNETLSDPGRANIGYPNAHNTIIKSFADHNVYPYDLSTWAMFDMHFVMPARYKLEKYSFKPGHFSMIFKDKNVMVELHRFSPASFLLNEKTLGQFMESSFNLSAADFSLDHNSFHPEDTAETVEYKRKESFNENNKFTCFLKKMLKKKDLPFICRASHLPEKNKILVVILHSHDMDDLTEFNKIHEEYNIV